MNEIAIVDDNAIAQHARACIESLPFVVGDDNLGRAQRHLALVFSSASTALRECTKESIGRAVALSAMSGLMPGGPRAPVFLIPRWNKTIRAKEANWQIAARGYQELAFRAGVRLVPRIVYENDEFSMSYGSNEGIVHVPTLKNPSRCVGGYVFGRSKTLPEGFFYMSRLMIDRRRAMAQDDSIWEKWPDEQTLKTLCSYGAARGLFQADMGARQAMAMSEAPMTTEDGFGPQPTAAPQITAADLEAPEVEPEHPKEDPEPAELTVAARVAQAVDAAIGLGYLDAIDTHFGSREKWPDQIEEVEDMISGEGLRQAGETCKATP